MSSAKTGRDPSPDAPFMKYSPFRLAYALAGCSLILMQSIQASNFDISGTTTSGQTLSSGQTGTVESTGTLQVSGSTVAITVSGTATITNNGTIKQTGSGRAIRDNSGGFLTTITNNAGALIQSAGDDTIQMNKSNSAVTLNNYGSIISLTSGQAIDWNAITTGANTLHNYSTGLLQSTEGDTVRPGVNGFVYNDGTIKSINTTDTIANATNGTDGVDAQQNSGISIINASNAGSGTGTGMIEGARHGITGGDTSGAVFTLSVTNKLGGTIQGDNGSGINIDGINGNELVTINNAGTITGNGHSVTVSGNIVSGSFDGDGVDVDGLVNLTNSGTIKSINSFTTSGTETSEGVTVGGGTITNSGTIEGDVAAGNTSAVGRGITVAGVDKDSNGNAIPQQAIYGNTTITNSGLIKGQSDSGIAVGGPASGFTVTINNLAGGTIEGGGATSAAIQTGADNDTINNAGSIIADSSGKAIDMGAGNNMLKITGGVASITGNVSGGTGGTNSLTIDPGTGQKFSYAGAFSNFSSAEIKSGTVVLSGASTYTGNTLISGGNLVATNVSGSATGTGQVTVDAGATLSGTGHLTPASGKSVLVNGILSVGDPTLVSPAAGSLSITTSGGGAIVLGAGSELHFDLFTGAGLGDNSGDLSSADRLVIGGNLTINSAANLFIDNPNNMSGWAIGDVWQIFNVSSLGTLTGSFGSANISLPSLSAGEKWDTDSLFTTGRLSVVSAPEAGPGLVVLALGLVSMVALRRRNVALRAA
jgi:hypothetical protein